MAYMKTPYWEKKVKRPESNAILSYEIYSLKSLLDEHTTIKTLNELVAENKAKSFYYNDFLWYAPTTQNP